MNCASAIEVAMSDNTPTPEQDSPPIQRVLSRLDALREEVQQLRRERDPNRLLTREEAA